MQAPQQAVQYNTYCLKSCNLESSVKLFFKATVITISNTNLILLYDAYTTDSWVYNIKCDLHI